jgi:hypothetical protein
VCQGFPLECVEHVGNTSWLSRFVVVEDKNYRTRGEHKYKIINAKHNIYKFSFFPRTVITWNYLPVTVALAPDLDSFRSGLDGVQFPPHCMSK